MHLKSIVTGSIFAASLASAAQAQTVLASDPQTLMNWFFEKGIPAQLTADSVGDPLIEFRNNGESMQVFFYDCENNKNCLSVQFYSGYKVGDSVDLGTINSWNADRRFVRAYLTDEGAARIEMDIGTSWDGISHRDFEELYSLWIDSVALFEERIGW